MQKFHDVSVGALQLVTASSADLHGYRIEENDNNVAFVQFFDAAATGDVTLGTTVADWEIRIIADSNEQVDPKTTERLQHFKNGIVIAVTTASNGNTAVSTAASVTLWYKHIA